MLAGVNKALPTSAQGALVMDLTEDIVTTDMPVKDRSIDPIPTQTPVELLSREILIFEQSISPATKVWINPIKLWSQSPGVNDVLNKFLYLRGDAVVRLVFLTTPQKYGYGLIGSVPLYNATTATNVFNTEDQQFQMRTVLLDWGEQQSYDYKLPYIHPNPWLNVTSIDWDAMWAVVLNNIESNTISSNIPNTIDIQLYFRWENLQLAGLQSQASNVIGSGLPSMDTMASVAQTVGVGIVNGMTAGVQRGVTQSVYEAVTSFANMGWAKEENTQPEPGHNGEAQEMSLTPYGQTALGVTTCRKTPISLNYDDVVVNPESLLDAYVEHPILSILKRPSVFNRSTFEGPQTINLAVNPEEMFGSYLWMLSKVTRFWRGGLKFSFHFFTSKLISARFAIAFDWRQPLTVWDNNMMGTLPTHVVSVQGSTRFDITLPFLHNYPWLPFGESMPYVPSMRISCLRDLVQAGDVVPQVFMVVLVSAADDFALAGERDCIAQYVPAPPSGGRIVESQCDINALHSGTFPVLNEGMLSAQFMARPDIVPSVETLMRRYSLRPGLISFNTTRTFGPDPLIGTAVGKDRTCNFDYLCSLFRFYKGGVRYKYVTEGLDFNNPTGVVSILMSSKTLATQPNASRIRFSDGAAATVPTIWPTVEVDAPFLSPCAWAMIQTSAVDVAFPAGLDIRSDETEGELLELVAPGKGFQLAYIMPLLYREFYPT